jgi:O-antigen/teichoic acid export membrane protein
MTAGFAALRGKVSAFFAGRAFARNVTLLAGSTALAQGSAVLVAPILTRIYSPADLGLFGIFFAFVTVAATVVCGRYDVAIVSTATRSDAALLTRLAILIAIPATLVCGLVALLFITRDWMGFGAFPRWIAIVAAASIIVTATFTALRYWFTREEAFGFVARFTALQGVLRSVAQVVLGLFVPTFAGLIGGDLLGRLAGVTASLRRAATTLREETATTGRGAWRAAAARHREFPLYALPSTLIDTLAMQLPVPLIGALFSVAVAGEFTLVQRVLGVPVGFIAISVADAFLGRAAALARESPASVKPLFLRTARFLLLAGVVPLLLVVLLGPLAFGWIFGEAWRGAGTLAAIMAPLALVQLAVSPVSRVILLVPRGLRMKLSYDVFALLLAIAALRGGVAAGLSPYASIGLYAGGQIAAYVFFFLLMMKTVTKMAEQPR